MKQGIYYMGEYRSVDETRNLFQSWVYFEFGFFGFWFSWFHICLNLIILQCYPIRRCHQAVILLVLTQKHSNRRIQLSSHLLPRPRAFWTRKNVIWGKIWFVRLTFPVFDTNFNVKTLSFPRAGDLHCINMFALSQLKSRHIIPIQSCPTHFILTYT